MFPGERIIVRLALEDIWNVTMLYSPSTFPPSHHCKACVWDEQQNFVPPWNPPRQAIGRYTMPGHQQDIQQKGGHYPLI